MCMDRADWKRIFNEAEIHATDPLPHTAHHVTNVLIHDQTDDLTMSATMVHSFTRVRSATVRGGLYDLLRTLHDRTAAYSFTMTGSSTDRYL